LDIWATRAIDFLIHNPLAVSIAALIILASATLAYWSWFRPAAVALESQLRSLSEALAENPTGWLPAADRARAAVGQHEALRVAWRETEERVIPLRHEDRTLFVMFGAPRDLWAANRLLSRSINLSLAETIPNLLVGVGLLFTFFFLTLALTQATDALLPAEGEQQKDLMAATHGLLSAAGAKFLTSLAGLLASIVWTIGARRRMARLSVACDRVLECVQRYVRPSGGEMLLFGQLAAARDLQQAGLKQTEVTSGIATNVQQQLELTEELLTEARDQAGTFKRFETDLAVSLAGAITNAFSPQMELMTNRLIGAIDGLREKIGTMNQDALQRMVEDFAGMLKKSTDSEMGQLRAALETLATQLSGAGANIGESASKAAEKLDQAGAELLSRVGDVSENLATGASNLAGATQGVKEAMNDLDVTICQASNLGKQGAEVMREALHTSETIFGRLKSVSDDLIGSAAALERVSATLAEAVDSVEEMTTEQRTVVEAVKAATPQALASVQRTLDMLQQTVQVTAKMMSETKDSMSKTSSTLGATVAEITSGVSEYSKMVADLHRRMDEQLAKAVGSLDKNIVELQEGVEELGEVLSSRLQAV
jgi:ABC-type transporter Mla subunit MlaD